HTKTGTPCCSVSTIEIERAIDLHSTRCQPEHRSVVAVASELDGYPSPDSNGCKVEDPIAIGIEHPTERRGVLRVEYVRRRCGQGECSIAAVRTAIEGLCSGNTRYAQEKHTGQPTPASTWEMFDDHDHDSPCHVTRIQSLEHHLPYLTTMSPVSMSV